MRRTGVALALAGLFVVGVVLVLKGRGLWERATPRSPTETTEAGADLQADTPPHEAGGDGLLTVSVPPLAPEGRVSVAIVDSQRILVVKSVQATGSTSLLGDAPEGQFLVAAIDNLSGSPLTAHLQSSCVWPAPIVVEGAAWPRDIEIGFREPATARRRISVSARTDAGKPVEGAVFNVSMLHPATVAELPVAFVASGADGLARSPWLPKGRFRITLQRAPQFLRPVRDAPLEVEAAEEGETGLTFLFRATGSLEGVVLMQPTQICAIDIFELSDSAIPFIGGLGLHTAADGTFEVPALPPGNYYAVSWPLDYLEAGVEFSVEAGRATRIVIAPQRGGATIAARLQDEDGKPLAPTGVNINEQLRLGARPSGRPFGTDADGLLRATGVAPGEKLAIIWKLGYLRRFSVEAGNHEVDLGTFRLPRHEGGVTVRGDVRDSKGTALRGAMICLQPVGSSDAWARFSLTDGDGRYQVARVAPGRYVLWHEPLGTTNYVARQGPEELSVEDKDVSRDLRLPRP